jgi:hypothetical protein
VRAALTDRVLNFFEPMKNDSTRLICPELAAQMARLLWRRERQAAGAELARISKKTKSDTSSAKQLGEQNAQQPAPELNRTEQNRTALAREADKKRISKKHQGNGGAPDSDFVAQYEAEQARETAGSAPATS